MGNVVRSLRAVGVRLTSKVVNFRTQSELQLKGRKVISIPVPEAIDRPGPLTITFTANGPNVANGTVTIADGSSLTDANISEAIFELAAALDANRTALDAALTALEEHGLIESSASE